jgi:hypothetical protein
MAAVDGISIRAITRSRYIRESIASRGFKLPKNKNDVMKLIHKHYEAKKKETIAVLSEKIKQNERFSLSLYDLTSARNKKIRQH